AYVRKLAEPVGAVVTQSTIRGNYALPGYETWGYVQIEDVPGFDPAKEFPQVRVDVGGGRRMFKVAHENVKRRGIDVRLGSPVQRLWYEQGEVRGVVCDGAAIPARRAVVLACGGFEASAEMQSQFWSTPPLRPVATLKNTGDGIRMAQEVGAGLWHMW